MRIEVRQSVEQPGGRRYWFVIIDPSGEVVTCSDMHKRKQSVLDMIEAIRAAFQDVVPVVDTTE